MPLQGGDLEPNDDSRVNSEIQGLIDEAESLVDQLRILVAEMKLTVEEDNSKP